MWRVLSNPSIMGIDRSIRIMLKGGGVELSVSLFGEEVLSLGEEEDGENWSVLELSFMPFLLLASGRLLDVEVVVVVVLSSSVLLDLGLSSEVVGAAFSSFLSGLLSEFRFVFAA